MLAAHANFLCLKSRLQRSCSATITATSKWSTLFAEQLPSGSPLPGHQFPRLLALPSTVVQRVISIDEKPSDDRLAPVPAASLTAKRLGISLISLFSEEFFKCVTMYRTNPAAVQVHWNSYCVEVTASPKKSLAKIELPAPLTPSLVMLHALLEPSVMTSYFDVLIANGDIDSAQALLYEHLACRPYFESAGSLVHVDSLVTKLFWAAYHRLDMLTAVAIWEYLQSKGANLGSIPGH